MIECVDLSAGYGGRPVVEGVDLAFAPGQVTVLLGPNGCGKTTLLKTALGLLPPVAGRVLYDGADLRGLPPTEAARHAAYMPQHRAAPRIEARRMALHGRFPYLSFPRALDEPTTWLDPKHQLEVMATARRLAGEGRAVGLVSHELSLALRTADRVALLAGGRLAAFGPPEEVWASGALEEAFGVRIGRCRAENGWHYYYL